jgi:hypothetical protein
MLKEIKDIVRLLAKNVSDQFGTHSARGSSHVRLEVSELEHRDTPASLSFLLKDGAPGFGTFTPPHLATSNPVDPEVDFQSFEVNDLVIYLNGETFSGSDFADTPTADYSYGEFLGVNFEIEGPVDYPLLPD